MTLLSGLYIPLPDVKARRALVLHLLGTERHELSAEHVDELCDKTEGVDHNDDDDDDSRRY